MFKFLLTDGCTEIIAIELEKLAYIKLEKTNPGSKLKLTGKIEVRRGIHMLRNSNIEVIWNNEDAGLFKTTGGTSF